MSFQRLRQKRELINLIRDYFESAGFFEIETPSLVPSPGMEPTLHGFRTMYEQADGHSVEYYLPTSPEFAIKKALAHDFGKVFEIARVFRNRGELGPLHHPEFNMLEWYEPGDYERTMERTEALLAFISGRFTAIDSTSDYAWSGPVEKHTISECFNSLAGLDLERGLEDDDYWRDAAAECLQHVLPADDSFEDIFFRIWLTKIESNLGKSAPCIVYDYPASMAALARLKPSDERWCERWELYAQGLEIGNAFSELTDPIEQHRRIEEANQVREAAGDSPHPIDHDLVEAVGKLPPTTGIAIGVERLLMAFTGESDIRNCFLQPVQ